MNFDINGIRFCRVISTIDETDAGRIKVRLSPEDNNKKIDDIQYAFPLMPKMLHVMPKFGEAVLVFLVTENDGDSQRFYIGPIISQEHKIYYDKFFNGADAIMRGGYKDFDVSPRMNPLTNGIFPSEDDIMIRGRKNSDIHITEDDIRIRAGVKLVNESDKNKMEFNKKNPSYGKFKYHTNPLDDGSQSTATIVADKIMLLSNNSTENFNTTDEKDLINDNELNKVIKEAYTLPYGEKLVDILKTMIDVFSNHTHKYSMLPPDPTFIEQLNAKKTPLLDNKELLSNTVKIN